MARGKPSTRFTIACRTASSPWSGATLGTLSNAMPNRSLLVSKICKWMSASSQERSPRKSSQIRGLTERIGFGTSPGEHRPKEPVGTLQGEQRAPPDQAKPKGFDGPDTYTIRTSNSLDPLPEGCDSRRRGFSREYYLSEVARVICLK